MMTSVEQLRAAILAQKPTSQQKEAIFTEDLEFLLRASPGSGKTWTSCRRFIWRAANWPYPVGGLALLSFTNAAIREFKTATVSIGQGSSLSDPNYVGTFDSFVERFILAPFGHLLTGAEKRPKLFPGPRPGDWTNKELKAWIDGPGNQKVPIQAWEIVPYGNVDKLLLKKRKGKELPSVAIATVRSLMSLGYYTHEQRVFWACKLLKERPHIADVLARRFPEIIVDEAQDSNEWLLVLLSCLREKGARVTLIGDPDQCIYEFSMANANSLPDLKKRWSIFEKPLSKSFRCNNQVAAASRNFGFHPGFSGCEDGLNEWQSAFIVKETSKTFSDSVRALQQLEKKAGIASNSSTIICRGHAQLESLYGTANYGKLIGKARRLADAAFLRDSQQDYRGAAKAVESILREITGDDLLWERLDAEPDSPEHLRVKLVIWKLIKDLKQFTPLSECGSAWVNSMRNCIAKLIDEFLLQCNVNINNQITTSGLAKKKAFPLLQSAPERPPFRQDTIHQVKGESLDGALVIGKTQFWNSVIDAVKNNENTEDRRLAYVAMTRARQLLVVGLPKGHFDKHSKTWLEFGFKLAEEPFAASNDVALNGGTTAAPEKTACREGTV
jgi:superfamily I DNA/RNA helicase